MWPPGPQRDGRHSTVMLEGGTSLGALGCPRTHSPKATEAQPGPASAPSRYRPRRGESTYCLNLMRVFSAGVPMTSWIFAIWSSSLAPGKRGCRLDRSDKELLGQALSCWLVNTQVF